MNKTRIEWCDMTWNPITGCLGGCSYCYARRIATRFKGHFNIEYHPDRLSEPLCRKSSKKIFVCSMSDFWGIGIETEWRETIITKVFRYCPQHTFLILTKQPQNIRPWEVERLPKNVWVGVTCTAKGDQDKIMTLHDIEGINRFVSFEPLMGKLTIPLENIHWVIIGAMTGPGSLKLAPKKFQVQSVLDIADRLKIPVFMKGNLRPYWNETLRQEFPNTMKG